MVRCRCQVSNTDEGAHRKKEFAHDLSAIVSEDLLQDAVNGEPMIKEDIFNVRCCCLGRLDSSSQFVVSVDSDKYVPTILCRFEKVIPQYQYDKE